MKQLSIIMMILAATMFLALPAAAKGKPDKPNPPNDPPITESCVWLDEDGQAAAEGVLSRWDGSGAYRCLFIANPADSYHFTIEAAQGTTSTILHPYIAVTDQYPSGGNICYREMLMGKVYPDSTGVFVEFIAEQLDPYGPADGNCGATPDSDGGNTYALTVMVQKTRGGALQLSMQSG
jgi:hypothetical protein